MSFDAIGHSAPERTKAEEYGEVAGKSLQERADLSKSVEAELWAGIPDKAKAFFQTHCEDTTLFKGSSCPATGK